MGEKTGEKQGERNEDGTFVAGKSGNPKGRPKGKSLTTQLREALKQKESTTDTPFDVLLVRRLMKKAIDEGDMKAIQMVWDRLEGKPKQTHEHSGIGGDPIAMKHEYDTMLLEIENMDNLWAGSVGDDEEELEEPVFEDESEEEDEVTP